MNYNKVNKASYFQTKKNFYPVFDTLNDPLCRVSLAIAMGCNVLPKGLHNFGSAKVFNIRRQLDRLDSDDKKRKEVVKLILSHDQKQLDKNKKNVDEKILPCLVDSIVYKPTCGGYTYTSPQRLEEYTKEYKLDDGTTVLTNDVKMSTCHSISDDNNAGHKFLSSIEREYTCCRCQKTYCEYCMFTTTDESDGNVCIKCKQDPPSDDALPSEKEMRNMLADAGGSLTNDATYSEVVKQYRVASDGGLFDVASSFRFHDVKYPLKGPEIFLNSNDVLSLKTEPTMMKDVSSIIIDENLSPTLKTDFIVITSSLVDIRISSNNKKQRNVDWRSVVSENILEFVNRSCVHEGERLIERSMRHALDPTSPTAFQSMFSIGIYKVKCVIVLHNKVKASMRSCSYDVSTCFNNKLFVASLCNCKVGTKKGTLYFPGKELKTCAHGITHLVSLSFTLFHG